MFLYPDNTVTPDWVTERFNNFNDFLVKINTENLPKNSPLLIEAIEKYILPPNIKLNKPLTKSEINKLLQKYEKVLINPEEFMWYYWLLMNAGFRLSTQFPSSIGSDSFVIPEKFINLRNDSVKKYNNKEITIVQLDKNLKELTKDIINYYMENDINISEIINSGAAGNADSIRQMLVAVGIVINDKKEIIDIISKGLNEGVEQTQFFNSANTAIQALYSKSADTAIPGYIGRKLSTILEHVKLSKDLDCGSLNGLNIKIIDKDMHKAVIGKYMFIEKTLLGKNLKLITENDNIIGKTIKIRSPLFCKSKDGICQTCLNELWVKDMNVRPGANIGLLSSTGITNTLTSLTLKKSHVGIGLDLVAVDLNKEIDELY